MPVPARLAALVAALALAVIAAGIWLAVRATGERHAQPCPPPPPGYAACDPTPSDTGFQTGDMGAAEPHRSHAERSDPLLAVVTLPNPAEHFRRSAA
jgi:hypothetical protein